MFALFPRLFERRDQIAGYMSGGEQQMLAIGRGLMSKPRILLTMATGTGKTDVAFQICWKLSEARWNRTGEHRRPRILYLADRNVLMPTTLATAHPQHSETRHIQTKFSWI